MERQAAGPPRRPDAQPSLLRRCALGIWLCGIALMGVVEFRRAAFIGDVLAMTPITWMWLAGSTVTGVIGIVLLVRELFGHRRRTKTSPDPSRQSARKAVSPAWRARCRRADR